MANKEFNVAEAYEAYSTGKNTINELADKSGMTSQEVVDAFDAHVQANKTKPKAK